MNLAERSRQSPYQSYVYAYPHKTAYRRLEPALPLHEVWATEDRSALFLYVHIPFCGMRCGFCNLFTQAKPADARVEMYLDALEQESERVRVALPDARFARWAIGGGTPTYLSEPQLERLLHQTERIMGVNAQHIPAGIEVSPESVTLDKIAMLAERGFERISMGIQSFIEQETIDSGRPQKRSDVDQALRWLKQSKIPVRNLDLIYGLPGQTVSTWMMSLRSALEWEPEELFLYPLYVRPLTALGQSQKDWDDVRLACYRAARDHLRAMGYQQCSLRMFRKPRASELNGPTYCCQDDGMIGLGCGARSYTRQLHYSGEYAVRAKGVKAILDDYLTREDAERGQARHGFQLNGDEQRRRFVLQSLLQLETGLHLTHYVRRFGSDPWHDLPELHELGPLGFIDEVDGVITLTERGVEASDVIGPYFYSHAVQQRMMEYEPQ